MNPRKEATYRMLSLIAAVIFVLPCVFLVFLTFDINPDDLWQMDSLMEFICAYKNTAILAIAGVLIQIVIALPAGYAIARIPSPKAQTFFLLSLIRTNLIRLGSWNLIPLVVYTSTQKERQQPFFLYRKMIKYRSFEYICANKII